MTRKAMGLLAGVAILALPVTANATTTFGSLGNFDAVNDTGSTAHGFEIDLEGIHASDITDTFGGAGRGFPTTVERYGAPTVTDYTTASGGFGARVVYQANLSGAAAGWIGTPSGVYTTPGESCWTGGGIGYGASTPCDHFGVGLRANPTKTTYTWLVEQAPGSSTLVNATSNVLAPTWTVTPVAPSPANPAPAPVVVAQIVAPPADQVDVNGDPLFGTAIWAKVFTTEFDHPVGLYDLVGGNPLVQAAHTETEWQLLQKDPGNPLSGILENGGAGGLGAAVESVLRRYEFYSFTGSYDLQSHEALFANGFGDSNPGPGDVGNFIGAQNAALNFGGAVAGGGGVVPEPGTWAMMIVGLGAVGAMSRRRRTGTVAA